MTIETDAPNIATPKNHLRDGSGKRNRRLFFFTAGLSALMGKGVTVLINAAVVPITVRYPERRAMASGLPSAARLRCFWLSIWDLEYADEPDLRGIRARRSAERGGFVLRHRVLEHLRNLCPSRSHRLAGLALSPLGGNPSRAKCFRQPPGGCCHGRGIHRISVLASHRTGSESVGGMYAGGMPANLFMTGGNVLGLLAVLAEFISTATCHGWLAPMPVLQFWPMQSALPGCAVHKPWLKPWPAA